MLTLDAVTGIQRAKLAGQLASVIEAMTAETSPIKRIPLTKQAADLVKQLGSALETASPASTELSDDPNSPYYRYKDTGYIAGSRKEKAAEMIRQAKQSGTSLRATDIDWQEVEANPRQAALLITKSNLFGQTDWEACKVNGMEPGAGFLVDRVYAAIGPSPATDGPMGRKDYAVALETIRMRLEKCIKPKDVTDVLEEINDELSGMQLNSDEAELYAKIKEQAAEIAAVYAKLNSEKDALYKAWDATQRGVSSLQYEQQKRTNRGWKPDPEIEAKITALTAIMDTQQAARMAWVEAHPEMKSKSVPTKHSDERGVYTTFKEVGGLRQEINELYEELDEIKKKAHARNIMESQLTRGWLSFGEKFFAIVNWRRNKTFVGHVTNARTGEIPDWSWAEKERAVVKKATKKDVTFHMKVTDKFERTGGKAVQVQSTAELKDMLGFNEVQSGNWVLDDPKSAKFHVEQTAGAMMDLSDMLGIDAKALGLGGRLGMAFGARGRGNAGFGGAQRAHYEPVHRVINLTKMGGGGALGHEWFHSIDNLLGELMGKPAPEGEAKNTFASGDPTALPAGVVNDAMRAVAKTIVSGDRRLGEVIKVDDKLRKMARYNIDERGYGELQKSIKAAGNATDAVLAVDRNYARYSADNKKAQKQRKGWREIAAAYYSSPDNDEVFLKTGPSVSNFYAEAVTLDSGEKGKYWSQMAEMSARAFQAYMEDRMAANGRKNDYLSALADNIHYKDPLFGDQKPFPEGDERKRINAAFESFFESLRNEKVLEKATGNKPLMDSIFGVIDVAA